MSNIVRREPFEGLTLRDAVDRLFEEAFVTPRWLVPFRETFTDTLLLDMTEEDDKFVIQASVPGFKPEEIDVSVVGDRLTIKGETKSEKKEERKNYVMRERRFGFVERTLRLPAAVVADKITAEFEHGVLTLTLPKAEEVKPKQIKIVEKGKLN